MDSVKNDIKGKEKKTLNQVTEESYLEKSLPETERQVGDGAPAENEIENSTKIMTDIEKPTVGFYLHIDIDLVCFTLLVLALSTRLYNLDEPRHIVFDELHYGRYVSLYTKGVFFFDAHPPLENCFLAQSRFMLLESIQMLFGLCGVLCAIKSTRSNAPASVIWLCLSALSLGCCFSVKYSGIYTYLLVLFLVGRQIWKKIGCTESVWRLTLSALWRLFILLVIPFSVYTGVFYAHLAMLPKAGPHDSVMTSAFQASLQGGLASITRGQPLHVAHGSQITLRHAHGRTCWLHSHAHVYPVRYNDNRGSSHQQQVTCYSFKDVNNWWIVKRPDQASLAVSRPPDAIRHGDVVQLLHGITSRALNSHDVAAPVSPQSQEVSCYIDYNVSMPAQNLWRVEIVNRDSEDATWDSIRSLVRLVHVDSGSALRYSGRQLPSWGFHQHEVVADKVVTHQDTVWNVEEHRYTKAEDRRERERELVSAEMIPTAATQLSFWEKFAELQYKMIAHAPDAPQGHMFASEPAEWPLLMRSIAYWLSPNSNAQIHLIGNLVTWYAGTISVLVYGALLAVYAVRQRRACVDLPPRAADKFYDAGYILFLGYWLHYLPYFFMDRTLFLHHYLPAYIFKILLLAYVIDHLYHVLQLRQKTRPVTNIFILGLVVWLAYVVITFKKFSVLNYGNTDLTENDLMNLRWKDTWDFILHKRG
ncbi:protein O-mannosyltransferase 1 isoform X2 [Pectinophora gossypiella]|uniref:protein O-mannosyltransferase 1 isoform X2 n=1 Tax=Pectinophora gossypiella TaxID=13191 RepID=UPI00214EB075|nr:protein O-mannosyltransferase 1 isoform X2 [Pectinophora gossypiella]